jgi:hypothetical protein
MRLPGGQPLPNPRVQRIVSGPIGPMLLRLSTPNIAVVVAQTAVTVADAWFVGRLGITALAALALVFPLQALMQMMSAGAMGGGISSAVARALGGARHADAAGRSGVQLSLRGIALRRGPFREILKVGVARIGIAAGGGAAALLWFDLGPADLFACVAAGLFSFGALIGASLFSRVWRPS